MEFRFQRTTDAVSVATRRSSATPEVKEQQES